MTPEEDQFLTQFHQALAQTALEPDDPRYVPVSDHLDAFGPDVISELTRAVALSTAGSTAFLTGSRGSGKTTQVLRLKKQLTARGLAVVKINFEDYLNLRRPIDVVEFLYAMVGAIGEAIAAENWIPLEGRVHYGWDRLSDWFTRLVARVAITPTVDVGVGVEVPGIVKAKANVKAELKADESFVAGLNAYLAGRVSELAAEANTIVGEMVDDLRKGWQAAGKQWSGLVVLFDSLDHVRGTDFTDVRRHLQDLFDHHGQTVRLHTVRCVYVVPQWLHIDGTVRRVVNVKVAEPDGTPFDPGVRTLVDLLRRRAPRGELERAFPDEAALRRLVRDSGGHIRDLLHLLQEAITGANALPFDAALLDRARQLVIERLTPLADDEKAALRHVRDTHTVPLPTQEAWEPLAALFDRHLVLGYMNGKIWYGVHPLIADFIGH